MRLGVPSGTVVFEQIEQLFQHDPRISGHRRFRAARAGFPIVFDFRLRCFHGCPRNFKIGGKGEEYNQRRLLQLTSLQIQSCIVVQLAT